MMIFSVVGISHWKSGVSIRELFNLDNLRKQRLREYGQKIPGGLLILDTCNRTELYGLCTPDILEKALCQSTNTDPNFLKEYGTTLTGEEAIEHIFRVGLGMDSQVLGDVQIIQQLKKAYKEASKEHLSGEFHQLIQAVFKAHKRSRNETDFGKGNASIGYEATKKALDFFGDISPVKILLVGAGKMGKVSCKNLISNGAQHISVINRSINRAKELATSFDIRAHSLSELEQEVQKADLIITATGASEPILLKEHLASKETPTLVIDLSIPRNVAPEASELPNITLIDMDTITEANEEALAKRKQALPKLEQIIREEIQEYKQRLSRSNYLLPRITEIDHKLSSITEEELSKVKHKLDVSAYEQLEEVTRKIQKKIMAIHIQNLDQKYQSEKNGH